MMDFDRDGVTFFNEVSRLLTVTGGAPQAVLSCVGSVYQYIRSDEHKKNPPHAAISSIVLDEIKSPETWKSFFVARRAYIESREMHMPSISLREMFAYGINTDAPGPIMRGSFVRDLVTAMASRCWNVVGMLLTKVSEVCIDGSRHEPEHCREFTKRRLAQVVNWVVTEAVYQGGVSSFILAKHLANSVWRPPMNSGEQENFYGFISAERLLRLCAGQAETCSRTIDVLKFLLLDVPDWEFVRPITVKLQREVRERLFHLRGLAKIDAPTAVTPSVVLVDKKIRAVESVFDWLAVVNNKR